MSARRAPKHQLFGITEHPDGGWSGTCTCGTWGYAGAPTKSKLKAKHQDHVREAGGGR